VVECDIPGHDAGPSHVRTDRETARPAVLRLPEDAFPVGDVLHFRFRSSPILAPVSRANGTIRRSFIWLALSSASCSASEKDAGPSVVQKDAGPSVVHLQALDRPHRVREQHAPFHGLREHRPLLYRAADAVDPTGGARELADSLYAELFGLKERDGERQSLFRYFHGRSSLGTWLRAMLAQRHVDRIRQSRRLEPMPADETPEALPAPVKPIEPERGRFVAAMQRAVTAALARLVPRDRLRLACYYAQNLTLAEIGRAIGEHEATVSRHLARTRRSIRQSVEHFLTHEEHMSDTEIAECFSSVVSDAGPLDLAELFGSEAARKNIGSDRSSYVADHEGPRRRNPSEQ